MSDAPESMVIALGGNAISPPDQDGDIAQQFNQTRRTAGVIAELIERGERLVLTHGNGPQVGNAIRRVELSRHEVYTLPLDICVADLQGGMGYMIAQCVNNELNRRSSARMFTTIVTAVEVDTNDPAFDDPTKPIGPFYREADARKHESDSKWIMREFAGKGFRRVVPSPKPIAIMELPVIRALVDQGRPVIACGGGGVPVARTDENTFAGREAVIDKDLASALLARELGAQTLLIATGVERVAIDFGKPTQRDLDRMTLDEARQYLAEGQFPRGSMGPKIEAAIDFLERGDHPDRRVIITSIDLIQEALAGKAGTSLAVR